MKNILLLLLSLVLIAGIVEAKIVTKDNLYQIPKTKIAPVIDGQVDAVWNTLDWNMMRNYHTDGICDSGAGLTGLSKMMWDANNLYILFYTVDDVVVDIPSNPTWNQDGVELFLDGSNDKTAETALKTGQYQWNIPHWLKGQEDGHKYVSFTGGVDTTGIEFKIYDVLDTEGFPGWQLELKIPLDALGIDGSAADNQKIGLEFQMDESDNGTARESDAKWWSDNGRSWADASLWGTGILSTREVDTVLQIVKASTAITLDGLMDEDYKNSNSITMNYFRVDGATDVSGTDPMFGSFVTAYPLWDANNFYLFCDVVDGTVIDVPTNPGWNQDAVELFLDGDNDHTPETALHGNQHQPVVPHWLKGQEAGHMYLMNWGTMDTTGIEVKITDHDMRGNDGSLTEEGSGFNVEFKIPLANFGVDGSSGAGAKFGFEIQHDNGNTTVRDGQQKWWSPNGRSWADASLWGYCQLSDEIINTKVKTSSSVISSYKLEQNYPNPFNPSTKITFELAKSEKVKLAVYNLLGEQVAELVNGMMSASSHTITFNAQNLASGIYFYRLEAGSTVLSNSKKKNKI